MRCVGGMGCGRVGMDGCALVNGPSYDGHGVWGGRQMSGVMDVGVCADESVVRATSHDITSHDIT